MQGACAILSSVACPALHDLRKKVVNKKRVVWFNLPFLTETFLIPRRNERDIIKNVRWSLRTVPFILVLLQRNLNYFDKFSKNIQISNFMNIRPVGAELFYAD